MGLSRRVTSSDIHTNVVFPRSIENGLEQGSSPPFHHMKDIKEDNMPKTKSNPSPVTKSAGSLI